MQISAQNLLPALTAQIAASVAQAAAEIGSTSSDDGTSGSTGSGATPTLAPSTNSSAASALSSSTLGALIQQAQTNQEPGEPPSLDTSGSTSKVAFRLNAEGKSLFNSVIAASDGGAGSGLTQFNVAIEAYFATQNTSNSLQTDLKIFVNGMKGANATLTQAQLEAAENWATSNSGQTAS